MTHESLVLSTDYYSFANCLKNFLFWGKLVQPLTLFFMAAHYILVGASRYYQFNADDESYPEDVATALGVVKETPGEGTEVTKAGTFADYGILRVRIKVVNEDTDEVTNKIRLCNAGSFSAASTALTGTEAFDGVIQGVYPVRKRLLI